MDNILCSVLSQVNGRARRPAHEAVTDTRKGTRCDHGKRFALEDNRWLEEHPKYVNHNRVLFACNSKSSAQKSNGKGCGNKPHQPATAARNGGKIHDGGGG